MENLNLDKVQNYNDKIKSLISNYYDGHIMDLFKEKNKLYPSIAIQDKKKIAWFTDNKIKDLTDKGQEFINKTYGNSSFYNPDMRKDNCIMGKAGKFFKSILPDIQDHKIQELVSKWYSIINFSLEDGWKFSLETDIKKYYHYDHYFSNSGILGKSCMRHNNCQNYLNFYYNYPVKLLVLKNQDDLIKGRALLWESVYFRSLLKSINLLDRIYVNNDNDLEFFRNYADKQGYAYKSNSYSSEFTYQGNNLSDTLIINPINENKIHNSFPYCDTFMNLSEYGTLSNYNDNDHYIELTCTDGGNSEEYSTICEDCGNRFDNESEGIYIEGYGYVCDSCSYNYSYCDYCNEYYHNDNGIYLDSYNLFVCDNCLDSNYYKCNECEEYFKLDDIREYNDEYYCKNCFDENFISCEYCGDAIHNDDVYKTDSNECLCSNCFDDYEMERMEEE